MKRLIFVTALVVVVVAASIGGIALAIGPVTEISLDPTSGQAGCDVTVDGKNWNPAFTVNIYLNDKVLLVVATPEGGGGFTEDISIPSTLTVGIHEIVARQLEKVAIAEFEVLAKPFEESDDIVFQLEADGGILGVFDGIRELATEHEILTIQRVWKGQTILMAQPGALSISSVVLTCGYDNPALMGLFEWRQLIVEGKVTENRKDCELKVYKQDILIQSYFLDQAWPSRLAIFTDGTGVEFELAVERIEKML